MSCVKCKDYVDSKYKTCPECRRRMASNYYRFRERKLAEVKAYNTRLKAKVFAQYSTDGIPECWCCGEREPKFLQLDHVNNDGAQHRRTWKRPTNTMDVLRYIIKNNYPDDFQILCANCNWGKQLNGGVCPHQK